MRKVVLDSFEYGRLSLKNKETHDNFHSNEEAWCRLIDIPVKDAFVGDLHAWMSFT